MKRVLLGMSGGVDSSAAVILLQEKGYEVVGITFRFIEDFDPSDAIKVAEKLSIEHHVVDYRKEFKELVINRFLSDYEKGLTPNPCVNCNKVCKFKYLFANMEKYNCDYVATGHYTNINNNKLYRSVDLNKDQSYFLCNLTSLQLSKIIFPLEGLNKDEVRKVAEKANLANSHKKDSYDVCFINDSFREYMNKNIKQQPGDIVDIKTNKVVGKHKGLTNYTIGQRRGLDIGGTPDRMFVVGKNLKKNILYIAIGEESEYLISDSCLLKDVNLINNPKTKNCTAKFRYRMSDVPVELEHLDNNELLVKYPQGVKRVTPGQACVLYDGDECLGGGIISDIYKNGEKLWYL